MPDRSDGDFSLYLLECGDGRLYTGIALDVGARLAEHRNGRRGARSLRGRGPLVVVFQQPVGDRSRAQRLEFRVRKLRHAGKLALINGEICLEDLDG